MIKEILFPNKFNQFVWFNAIFLLFLVVFNYADSLTVVFAYFLETIIIGIIHCVKLLLVSKYGQKGTSKGFGDFKGIGLVFFFLFHYGMFVGVQSVFAFTLFESEFSGIKDGFNILDNYSFIIQSEGMSMVLGSLVLTNLGYLYTNFLSNEKYKDYTPEEIFIKPYARIFIQQFVVLLAFFFYVIFSDPIVAAILLIFFRLLVDLVIVSIRKDSDVLDTLARKSSNSYDHYLEMKKKYQEFSE